MMESSSSSDCSWFPMFDAPVGDNVIGEVLWQNRVGVLIDRRVDEFSHRELACWALFWLTHMSYARRLMMSYCFWFCSRSSFSSTCLSCSTSWGSI